MPGFFVCEEKRLFLKGAAVALGKPAAADAVGVEQSDRQAETDEWRRGTALEVSERSEFSSALGDIVL